MRLSVVSAICCSVVLFAAPAFGGLIVASGAGPLLASAEDLTGTGVTEIQGNLDADAAASVFKIDILDPVAFWAQTLNPGAFGIPDTELFLFDSAGLGIYFNDDITASNTFSCLPSSDGTNPCPLAASGPLGSGTYYLAIARSASGPLDGSANEIFTNSLTTDVVGPNAGAGALADWDNGAFTDPNFDLVNYDIVLNGTTTPEPGTWMLLTAGLLTAIPMRRHRRR